MAQKDQSRHAFEDPKFRRVISASTAGAIGLLFASMAALDRGPEGFEFHWSYWALPWFGAGVVVGWGYWVLALRLAGRGGTPEAARRTMARASTALLVVAVVSFLYPLRFSNPERRADIAVGLSIAAAALGFMGWLLRTVVRALQESSAADEAEHQDPGNKDS
jgi:hypothetical protein